MAEYLPRMCRTQTPTTSEIYWEDLVFKLEVEKSFQNQGWLPILAYLLSAFGVPAGQVVPYLKRGREFGKTAEWAQCLLFLQRV